MRFLLTLVLGLFAATLVVAQPGMMGGMPGMGMGMGMGQAPSVIDVGPVWSPDSKTIYFSRVNAAMGTAEWKASPVQGGMGGMGMGMEGGMGAGMPGGMGMGMGMGMGGPDLQAEGLFSASCDGGGDPTRLVEGRTIIQDSRAGKIAYVYQGLGNASFREWGIYGMSGGGGGKARWYPAILPWVRVSPDGANFVIPYDKGKSVVFFPAKSDAQQYSGYAATPVLDKPVSFTEAGDAIWIIQEEKAAVPAGMGGGMGMEGGMMGGGMPGMMPGMGMGMGAGAPSFNIALGKPDQTVTAVVKKVGKGSFAVSIPGGTDIAAYIEGAPGAAAGQSTTFPGNKGGLYIYGQDGTEKRKLTGQKVKYMEASPDGKYVAFLFGDKTPLTVAVAPVDGGPISRVGFSVVGVVDGSVPFSWSPNSRRLAFGTKSDDVAGIVAVDVATGAAVQVSTAPQPATTPPAAGPGG